MARVKLAGVGDDLPLLQDEVRATRARVVAASTSEAGFLRTIFIASPVNFTSWMQTREVRQSMDNLLYAVGLIFTR